MMRLRINAWVRRWVGNDWQHFVEGDIVDDDTEWGRRLLRLGAATIAPGSGQFSSGGAELVSGPVDSTSSEELSEAEEPGEVETAASSSTPDRPLMTASIAVWRDYAAKLGIKTTGMKRAEIIGAVNSYESQ